ncbi:MAG TPA: ABC transporter ATP-binding protein [Firmicutes bacterium]|nr:ABC transporter ATP-binding protein [Bacillota bacterium]
MLSVNDINVYYGAIHALKGVSFHVDEGEVVSLIGANGAGKTTAMHTVSGLLRSRTGDIAFLGQSIAKTEPHKIVRMGLAQVPEGRRVFASLSVQENLEMGAFIRSGKDRAGIGDDLEMVFTRFPRLRERRRQQAGTLSGGEQQMLAIGRALMSRPKMLLLDEPSMGLSPILVQEIFDCIEEVKKGGTTVLLVEQNAKMALSISDRAYVLETGMVVLEGKAADLLDNEQVRRAYLGG